MRSTQDSALTFINARISGTVATTLRIVGSRIAALGVEPETSDRVIDLCGDRLLPGLINAHDHLQLNSLPLEFRKQYAHAHEWILEVDALKKTDRTFQASVAVPRDERLLIGGLKNLLSGVTTVAHHDPFYPLLGSVHFPVRVAADYGWSHSLYIDGEAKVRDSNLSTPSDRPWIIHAAEGLDSRAADEFERLDVLGCIRANTLIVHGITLDPAQRARLIEAQAGLIWCPSSNLRLFGRTAEVSELIASGRVALGTDSRLSGARDLLEELRVASVVGGIDTQTLESLVTDSAARLLRLPDVGVLKAGARADILILPAQTPLLSASRADFRLVLLNGMARYGDEDYVRTVAPVRSDSPPWAEVLIDSRPKLLDGAIAARLSGAGAQEPGLKLSNKAWRAA